MEEQLPFPFENNQVAGPEMEQEDVYKRQELPAGYRTILNLAVFGGMPHKEIATTLGINEHSSSSQLYLSLIHI